MEPTKTSRFQKIGGWVKQHPKTSVVIAGTILIVWFTGNNQPENTTVVSSTVSQTVSEKPTPPASQTDQQKLEAAVQSQLGGTSTHVSFKDVNIDKDDPARPAGSKFITVDLNLIDFLDKDELLRDSGTIVSNIIQQVYVINSNFYDVIVMFYGPTKDQYGNSKNDAILSYGTDRPEEQRINWAGFDKTGLCSLLTRDATAQNDVYLGCHLLVNVQ